ncbi:polycystin-1-like protein 2 [Glandiceps talaboti]
MSGRHDYCETRSVALNAIEALDAVMDSMLQNQVPGGTPTIVSSPAVSIALSKQEMWMVGDTSVSDEANVAFQLPSANILFGTFDSVNKYDTIVNTKIHRYAHNPFIWDEEDDILTSEVASLELTREDESIITVESLQQPIKISVPHSDSEAFDPIGFELTVTTRNLTLSKVFLNYSEAAVLIDVSSVESLTASYGLYLSYNDEPNRLRYDFYSEFPRWINSSSTAGNMTSIMTRTWVIQPNERHGEGEYGIGIEMICNGKEWCSRPDYKETRVNIMVYSAICRYWNKTDEKWQSDGCWVTTDSTIEEVKCECNHLSFFGSSVFVAPYKIDFAEDIALFKDIDDNPVMLVTISILFGIYFICAFWAYKKDRRDRMKRQVIVLSDNDPKATFNYHVTVFTGARAGAGTTAHVALTITGAWGKSITHILNPSTSESNRKVLQSGGVDSFLLTTRKYLGELKSIRLWHDNANKSPSWFVSRVCIHDLQTDKQWHFLCKTWLSTEAGKIDETFPVASFKQLTQFSHLFMTSSIRNLRDRHLWLSIFSRPAHSLFTRLQRVSCCLSLLLTSMVTGLMFYGVAVDPTKKEMDFGHFSITLSAIMIGIESGLIAMPINIIIVQIFRKLKAKSSQKAEKRILRSLQNVQDDHVAAELYDAGSPNTADKSSGLITDVERERSNTESIGETNSIMSSDREPVEDDRQIPMAMTSSQKASSGEESAEREHVLPVRTENILLSELDSVSTVGGLSSNTLLTDYRTYIYKKLQQTLHDFESMAPTNPHHRGDYDTAMYKLKKIISLQELYIQSPVEYYKEVQNVVRDYVKKHQTGVLPWWCVYIGWFLVWSVSLTSAFFIIWYGLKYGRAMSINWLISTTVSFLQSIFVIQPFKVVVLAAVVSFFIGSHQEEKVGINMIEYIKIDPPMPSVTSKNDQEDWKIRRQQKKYFPPSQDVVVAAKRIAARKEKVGNFIRDLVCSIMLLWLVTAVAYTFTDQHALYMNDVTKDIFADNIEEVRSYIDLFNWINETLLPGLFEDSDGFIDRDCRCIKMFGGVRLRQVRVKPEPCQARKQIVSLSGATCKGEYQASLEDMRSFTDSWGSDIANSSDPSNMWHYQTADRAQGSFFIGSQTIYSRGGYVADLGNSPKQAADVVQTVHDASWLDSYTRAVFVEWSMYSSNVNLISVVTFLFEVLPTGGLIPSVEILTSEYYKKDIEEDIFILVCKALYILVTIYFTCEALIKLCKLKKKYFHSFLNVLDLVVLPISWLAIVNFIIYMIESDKATSQHKLNEQTFTSFYNVAFAYQATCITTAIVVFLSMIKFLKFLRTNSSVYLLQKTFYLAGQHLLTYSIFITCIIFIFANICYLIFGSKIADYRNMFNASESLFTFILGIFDLEELFAQNPVLGPIVFSMLIISVYFILAPIYTIILISAFLEASKNREHSAESDLLVQLFSSGRRRRFNSSISDEQSDKFSELESTSFDSEIDDQQEEATEDERMNTFIIEYLKTREKQ